MNEFTKTIVEWYEENKRELPWRESADPYLIWISEIILQQTRVAQGYDYFLRFIKRFPDVQTLAAADEDEVMKYWQGLGYYSRARNLHAAAKSMNGVFPKTYPEVLALKGVGGYTAAAICSFAYGMPYAVVDGNVYRVLSRYFGIDTPIDSTEGKKLFAALADEMLDKKHPAVYNQGIMDFGAIQCTPQSPNCLFCPLAGGCSALSKGLVTKLPVKQHKTKTTNRYFNYIYVRAGAYTFINKRTGNDIWKNLFELPLIETPTALSEEEFLALPEFRTFFASGEVPVVRSVCREVKHVLSHRVIYANLYEVTLSENLTSFGDFQKIKVEELVAYLPDSSSPIRSGLLSRVMHLSTSRIKRLTRAIALLWSGAFPASPWLSCTRASSLPSSFTCICKSRFSLRKTSRSAAVSLQRAVSRRWSAMSCRICASKSLMTFFSAIYLSPEIFSAFPKVYKKRQTTKFYFMIISFRVPRYGKRSGPIPLPGRELGVNCGHDRRP